MKGYLLDKDKEINNLKGLGVHVVSKNTIYVPDFCIQIFPYGNIRVKSIVLYEYQAVRDNCKEVELDDSLLEKLTFFHKLAERTLDDLRNLTNEVYSSLSKGLVEK